MGKFWGRGLGIGAQSPIPMKYYLYKLYFLEKIFLLIIILKEKIVFLTKFIKNPQIGNYTLSLE